MTMRDFIRQHRDDLDAEINRVRYRHNGHGGPGIIPDPPPRRSDAERHEWVLNDEGLYLWARAEGVRI